MPERAIAEVRLRARRRREGRHDLAASPGHPLDQHPSLHPFYAQLEARGVPLLFHVEGDAPLRDGSRLHENGWEGQTDFHGGGENFTGLPYMAVSHWVGGRPLGADLRPGAREVPPAPGRRHRARRRVGPAWLEQLGIVKDTFGRTESRIGSLSLRPTEYVRRQVRVTPYPTEDLGRLIEPAGPSSSCSRRTTRTSKAAAIPLKRFEASLCSRSEAEKHAFYAGNFAE